MEEKVKRGYHSFISENREKTVISGVKEVISFDDNEVHLFTELGELKIKGKDLQVVLVDTEGGDVELHGRIDALQYTNTTERVPNNFITKLFK